MKIAVVGASGLVGESLCNILARKLPEATLQLYGNKSVGKRVCYGAKWHSILPTKDIFDSLPDVAMFMANEEVAKELVPKLSKLGVTCIDNSSYFRMHPNVPLVVPSINKNAIGKSKIVANPNCTTIQVAMTLNCLKSLAPYKVTVATYQAVSGAGREGLLDLQNNREYGKTRAFAYPIANNVLPLVGSLTENGYTTEEIKMQQECVKILQMPLDINCFCVRVPVDVGHSAFVNVQFERTFTIKEVQKLLERGNDILTFWDDDGNLPMPMCIRGSKFVGVGRVLRDATGNGINMFVVADNLLRGASYNAYEILQCVLQEENLV